MLIYEPTSYQELNCNLHDIVYDYISGSTLGTIIDISWDSITLSDHTILWRSGLERDCIAQVEKFDTYVIKNLINNILWIYSIKHNIRIKC
jgi:hypothetical protein